MELRSPPDGARRLHALLKRGARPGTRHGALMVWDVDGTLFDPAPPRVDSRPIAPTGGQPATRSTPERHPHA